MLLRNTHIEKPFRVLFRKLIQARAYGHRCGYSRKPWLLRSHINHFFAENIEVRGTVVYFYFAGFYFKGQNPVEFLRFVLRKTVTLSFLRQHMNKYGPFRCLCA